MASQGPLYPTNVVTVQATPEDDNDWLNPSNVGADDGSYASITAATYDANDISWVMVANTFGFTIPAGATIDGIVVEIQKRAAAGAAEDFRVNLADGAGASPGDNKADTVAAWPGTDTTITYGSSTDTWNAGMDTGDTDSAQFGVKISVQATAANTDIHVDFIRMTVYYTASDNRTGSGSPTSTLSSSASGTATRTLNDSSGSGTPTSTLSSSASGTAVQSFTGSGTPTSTLSSSASGTAVQSFTGSGTPTSTLSSSASGSGTNTPDGGGHTGSGSPTSTLSSSAAGTATRTLNDSSGSGSPTSTLSSGASGTGLQTFNGSGAPTSTLSSSVAATAVQSFNGSGTPTSTVSSSAAGTATRTLNDSSGSGTPTSTLSSLGEGVATTTEAISTPVLIASRFNTATISTLLLPSTGTLNLVAGRLYVLVYAVNRATAPDLSTGYTISHSGVDKTGSWEFIRQTDAFSSGTRRMAAYWYIPASNETSIAITFDPAGGANSNNSGVLFEIAAGFEDSAPIAQSAQATATAALSLDVSLPVAPLGGNLSFSAFFNKNETSVVDPRGGWTELSDDQGEGTGIDSGALESQYRVAAEQTASASVSATNRDWGGLHIEIRAASTAGIGSPTSTLSSTASGTATNTGSLDLPYAPDPPAPLRTVNVDTQSELVAAANDAQPGDLIVLAAGTYLGGIQMLSGVGGTAANPVVFQGPRTAIVDRNGSSGGFGFRIRGPYVQLRGFTVRNALFGVMQEKGTGGQEPTDCVFDDMEVRDVGQNAYVVRNGHRSYIQRGLIKNTGLSGGGLGEGIYGGHSSDTTQMSDDVKVLDNDFGPDNRAEFIDVKGLSANRCKRWLIQGNRGDATGMLFNTAPAVNGAYTDQGSEDTLWKDNVVTGINSAGLSGFFFFTSVRPVARSNTVDPAENNISGAFGYRVLNPTTDPVIYCDNIGTMNVTCTPVEEVTGAGSPTDSLSSSVAGTATRTLNDSSGSGTPASTLSSSASSAGVQSFNGSGSPTSTLSSSASGAALQEPSTQGSGSPISTLSSVASGVATNFQDVIVGSGSPATSVFASGTGAATQTFTGSGAPTDTLSTSASGTGLGGLPAFEGPEVIGINGPDRSTGDRQVDWPGMDLDPGSSEVAVNDIAILIIGTKNEPVPAVSPLSGAPGTASVFTNIPAATIGIGAAAGSTSPRVELWWCRATSHDMAPVVITDPGQLVVAAMVTLRGCLDSGDPWDVINTAVISPAEAAVTMPVTATTVANCLVLGASIHAVDVDDGGFGLATDFINDDLNNLTEIIDRAYIIGNGVGIVAVTGEKRDVGAYADHIRGTYGESCRSAGVTIALKPLPPSDAVGSGAPTSTLSSSVSGDATSTPVGATGAPVSTLVSSASGTAQQLETILVFGAPNSTLNSSATGSGSLIFTGSGAPAMSLVSVAQGTDAPGGFPTKPPGQGHGHGPKPPRPKRTFYVVPEEEPKKRKRRRRKREPLPVPVAVELLLPELKPLPFTPYTFDPMLWQSLAMQVRPEVPVVPQVEIDEEEAFLAKLLEVI